MKWLNSLDELLYEVMSWLIFYPLTLWRTLSRPLSTMNYADQQLALPDAEQYADAISPPLFLALTLALSHGFAVALGQTDEIEASHRGLAGLVSDDSTALVFRLIVFAIFPLVMSVRLVRGRKQPLNRSTLRMPFYAQCYPASIFALGLSIGTAIGTSHWQTSRTAGAIITSAALLYYVMVETRWFRAQRPTGLGLALLSAILGLVEGFILLVAIGILFRA
ncbi:hypothetical protein ACM61V_00615 [Sphingomonas sp. TX0543]|uniref:hypothetical protein n=1 Tax=unclassified Sphingomonas TaxID=196159 RepID=UPI0010F7BF6A|nr:hypothetical protein [Sphingomonas sp. 3P27F8]